MRDLPAFPYVPGQQQAALPHDLVDALLVDLGLAPRGKLPLEQSAHPAVAIGWSAVGDTANKGQQPSIVHL